MSHLPASLVLAEKSAPRYTSYPTAPQFRDGVNGETAARWMGALSPDARLSLYLHVPYCRAICNYCGCNTKAVLREAPLDAYADTLAREIELVAGLMRARRVTHIHWGGGTPSLLGPARLRELWRVLRARFDMGALDEHAIELDPRVVDVELADALAAIGITRVSFGVQDFNEHVQRAIGRLQPLEVVQRAVAMVREAGVGGINLDLMYGLPEQSLDDVRRTAGWAADLAPSRLAMFGYAHVPWMKAHQKLIDASALPGAAERLAQAAAARAALEARGYRAIGLDHFARADDPLAKALDARTLRRNFQGYTTDAADALIGLGASSIGRLPQGFVQNAPDVAGWRRAVEASLPPVTRGLELTDDDRLRGEVIERLMCDFAVDYGALAQTRAGDATALDDAVPALDALARERVLIHEDRRVRMSAAGEPFVRLAAAAFDAWLKASAGRHSVAV